MKLRAMEWRARSLCPFALGMALAALAGLAPPAGGEEPARGAAAKAAPKAKKKTKAAEEPPPPATVDPADRAPPADAGSGELARAIRESRRELDQAQIDVQREEGENQARMASESRALETLLDQEAKLAAKLRSLKEEIAAADTKGAAAAGDALGAGDDLEKEITSRISGLRERLEGCILATHDPQLVETLAALRAAAAGEPAAQVKPFLDICARVLQASRSAEVIPMHLRVASAGGKIEPLRVLRVGNVAAYFSRPAEREGGFVTEAPGEKTGFIAESRGLTPNQMDWIMTTIQKPDKGGLLPCDVAGGAGAARLRTKESVAGWFRRGGVWMWPIAVLAALAAYLILERCAVLLSASLSTGRRLRRITALVRAGRVETAAAACEKAKGPAARVLGAALLHRSQGQHVLETSVQEALLRAAPAYQSRLGFLSLIATIATLAGFLGTVAGLLTTFQVLDVVGLADPRPLTGGLADALIPTVAGLIVAIPCVLFRGLLGALAESSIGKLEAGALGLLVALERTQRTAEEPLEIGEPA